MVKPGHDHETQDLAQEQVAPAKQEKAKLPMLVVTEGVVTENNLDMFQQQLMSYKRLAGLTSTTADTVLQGLPSPAPPHCDLVRFPTCVI